MTETPLKLYILEDDLMYGAMLRHFLQMNPDYEVKLFVRTPDFLTALDQDCPDVVTLDYNLPDGDAAHMAQLLKEKHPHVAVVVVSGQSRVDTAVDLLKMGVRDYIVKDEHTQEKLWLCVHKLKAEIALRKENERLREALKQAQQAGEPIIGTSPSTEQLRAMIARAAGSDINVILYGETGTGKELAAQAIHRQSKRQGQPFVAVNVAAIPAELAESELFGHEKGAFTGASQRRQGKFEEADGGTLFLDEIGEMPLPLQAKLLRVLQDKAFSRVGGNQVLRSDFRMVAATHRQLPQMVKEGRFREDLYYRLQGFPITLAPLRQRGGDVVLIARQLIDAYCRQHQQPEKGLAPEAAKQLLAHQWPGNVRELKNVMELACVLSEGKTIEPQHLIGLQSSLPASPANQQTLKDYTTQLIQHHLNEHDDDVVAVAKLLGIGKSTIYRMIQNRELILGKNTTAGS